VFSDKKILFIILFLSLASCGGMEADLLPDATDRRPTAEAGTVGPLVGQTAPDFELTDSLGGQVRLSTETALLKGVVLYFTMWCPVCDGHMSHMRSEILPYFPDVEFLVIDFTAASPEAARDSEVANGYAGSGFVVLADADREVQKIYGGAMGTVVLVDGNGIVRMNEDYKDGVRLEAALEELE